MTSELSKYNGEGVIDVPGKFLYKGGIKEGKFDGTGHYQAKNGNSYQGTFVDGKRQGRGICHFANGDYYEGEYWDNQPHGQGRFQMRDGAIYVGEVVRGAFEGFGVFFSKEGGRFEGEFQDSNPHGKVSIVYPDKSTYVGDMKMGRCDGEGVLWVSKDKSRYIGQFYNDLPHGKGTRIYDNGSVYEGEYRAGEREGRGIFIHKTDGYHYEGEWKKNHFEGQGILTFTDRTRYECPFKDGKAEGWGICIDKINNIFYEGFFQNGKKQGMGTEKYEEGSVYKGEFFAGVRHGYGKLKLGEGCILEGEFRNDIPMELASSFKEYAQENAHLLHHKDRAIKLAAYKDALFRKNLYREAIGARRKNFEKNLQSISSQILTSVDIKEKKRKEEEELDRIVKEIGLESPTPKKGKSPKPLTSPKLAARSVIEKAPEPPPPAAPPDPIRDSPAPFLKEHARLKRWSTADREAIRKFTDYPQGEKVQYYANLDDDDIDIQRMRHYLPGIENLLGPGNKNKYFVETKDGGGYKMAAWLLKSDKEDDVEFGEVFLCVNSKTKTVFHKMFTPWSANGDASQSFFKSPELPKMKEGEEEGLLEPAGNCSWDYLEKGIIQFKFSNAFHKLWIVALNS